MSPTEIAFREIKPEYWFRSSANSSVRAAREGGGAICAVAGLFNYNSSHPCEEVRRILLMAWGTNPQLVIRAISENRRKIWVKMYRIFLSRSQQNLMGSWTMPDPMQSNDLDEHVTIGLRTSACFPVNFTTAWLLRNPKPFHDPTVSPLNHQKLISELMHRDSPTTLTWR